MKYGVGRVGRFSDRFMTFFAGFYDGVITFSGQFHDGIMTFFDLFCDEVMTFFYQNSLDIVDSWPGFRTGS